MPRTVPEQPISSPMVTVNRRLPDWQGEMISVVLDERALNALTQLVARHQQTAVSVLCEVIERARDRAGITPMIRSYSGMVLALAIKGRTSRSAAVREAIVAHYVEVFGRQAEGRTWKPRVQQFEGVRRVYQDAHRAARKAGRTKRQARVEAEEKTRTAFAAPSRPDRKPVFGPALK